jgi:hexosaminidase
MRRVSSLLHGHQRRLVAWDEMLDGEPGGDFPTTPIVQAWRSLEAVRTAVARGYDVIASPTSHAYFDYDAGTTDLRKVYSFEPLPGGLEADAAPHLLGGECTMWTEYATVDDIDQRLFPRILAMAERLWSPRLRRDFGEFRRRVDRHRRRLEVLGVEVGPETGSTTIPPWP